jgi:DNA-binding transcriptional ArsR family regulator
MKKVSNEVSYVKKGLTELCYGFFSTLANPTRLAIIERLIDQPMNVTDLAEALGQEQSMISHNLRPLMHCNFVNAERKGKQRIYSVNIETVEPLVEAVENHATRHCGSGDTCPARRRLRA